MKRIFFYIVLLFGLVSNSFGQDISNHALGLRLGNNNGFGGEISYQKRLFDNRRLEFNLGWRNNDNVNAFKVVGLYQWVWNLENNFNWYAGAGGGLGSWNNKTSEINTNGTLILATGNLGIEYNFEEIPLLLSLDFRPEIYLISNDYPDSNFGSDIALSIRYRF